MEHGNLRIENDREQLETYFLDCLYLINSLEYQTNQKTQSPI